jgi:hypothetical protein
LPMVERPVEVQESHFPLRVTSIFFQEYDGLSTPPPEHPVQHAYGKMNLMEKLGDCQLSKNICHVLETHLPRNEI